MSFRKLLASVALGLSFAAGALSPVFAADDHIINMQDVDIKSFIEQVGIVTGRTFVIDPRVNGKVNIVSEKGLNDSQVFAVFKEVLRVHGYTVVRAPNGEYRVTLLQGAAQDAPFSESGNGIYGQFSTIILRVPDGKAAEAARLIKPVMHSQGQVSANPDGSIIVVTDFAENLRKAKAITEALGSGGSVRETIRLSQLSVIDAEDALKQLGGPKAPYKVVAVEATNSLIVEGSAEDVAELRRLLERVEGQPAPTVAHDIGSNTLIISAPAEVQADLERIIRRLDERQPQVLVEAIIVEISDTAAKELGVQFALGGINGSTVPLLSSNFSRQAGNLLNVVGALGADDVGLSDANQTALQTAAIGSITGLDGGAFGIGGASNDVLFGLILNALETDDDSNILSTPFVTTLDNVPATFLVGQEIPITTGSSLGTDNLNAFQTFERQEVGIQLDVLPQISDGDVIRLEIEQIVSSISGALTSTAGDFVLNKSEITTTVLANDGEIIVLGGLIQDDEEIRTSLMVFLRPKIIRSVDDARPLTEERLNFIRQEDLNQSGRSYSKIDQFLDNLPVEQQQQCQNACARS